MSVCQKGCSEKRRQRCCLLLQKDCVVGSSVVLCWMLCLEINTKKECGFSKRAYEEIQTGAK